jgi:2-polyprenyl-3-methyl-5-hydroxy-6-metoxy-1,4-benzoquinol methylase
MKESIKNMVNKVVSKDSTLWSVMRRIYNDPLHAFQDVYHRVVKKDSIFLKEEDLYMCSLQFPKKLKKTLELFHPKTVLDLGCGTGQSLDMFLNHGIDVTGIEGSAFAKSRALHPEQIQVLNLNKELTLERRFDLIWCMEVVEHIHPDYIHNLMKTFSNHSDRIVLSAAPPGQGGEGHFNEQPASYWIDLFEQYGFSHDRTGTKALQQVKEIYSEICSRFTVKF